MAGRHDHRPVAVEVTERPSPRDAIKPYRILAWGLAALCILGVIIHSLTIDAQSALKSGSDYNPTWVASQSAIESARLQAALNAWLANPGDETARDVALWADILAGRAPVLDAVVRPLVANNADASATLSEFNAAVSLPSTDEDGVALTPELAASLSGQLRALAPRMAQLASQIYGQTNARAASLAERLALLQRIFLGITGLLFIGCSTLVLGLWRTNASLRKAQDQIVQRDALLSVQNHRFSAALNNMPNALCMYDHDDNLVVVNASFFRLFHLKEEDAAPGTGHQVIFSRMIAANRMTGDLITRILLEHSRMIERHERGTFFRVGDDGRALELSHRPLRDGGWLVTYEDITERRKVEQRVMFLAHHDPLTGLPNRELFLNKLRIALTLGEQLDIAPAVFFVDLDDFKLVNDTLGHKFGDELLRQVATRLRSSLPSSATVARLGGDEFAIILPSQNERSGLAALAQELIGSISEPYLLDGHRVRIGASIGIVQSVRNDPEDLLKRADMALYSAKGAGRGTWRFFESDLEQKLMERLAVEADLQRAITDQEFELHFQPMMSSVTGRISAFEALLRWRHPERGILSPIDFIPILEETGQIVEVGQWVLETACRAATAWPEHVVVAVNFSALQFRDPELASSVLATLRKVGLAPHRLEIEITESVLLSNYAGIAETIADLRAEGVRFALDDFGTGYSSLSYLLRFSFDRIKIDRSFVHAMTSRPDSIAIVQFIASLATQIGMATTAEGVETLAQFQTIKAAGCTDIQGWFIGRPMPEEQTMSVLAADRSQAIPQPAS